VTDFSTGITRDLILNVPISPTSGFETIQRNFGTLRSNIVEFALTGMPIMNKKWELTASFNISKVSTKVLELPNHEPVVRDAVLDNGKFITIINEGDAMGTIYGLK
jgi:hypothetical protein